MSKTGLAVLFAVCATVFMAIGDVYQQHSAHEITDRPTNHRTLYKLLLRNRQWWFGTGAAIVGFTLQAVALGFGSVLLVQALLVCSLLFALPIGAGLARHRITTWQWMWAVILAVSVTVFVVVGDPQAGQSHASWKTWAIIAAVAGPTLMLCLLGARILPSSAGAVLLALASGGLWGVFTVLTKGVVDQLDDGVWEMLHSPELYAWLTIFVTAAAWQQSAFHAGSLTASLPTMTMAEPVVAALLGVIALGETLDTGGGGRIALVVAVIAMAVATGALARSEAAAEDEGVHAGYPKPQPRERS